MWRTKTYYYGITNSRPHSQSDGHNKIVRLITLDPTPSLTNPQIYVASVGRKGTGLLYSEINALIITTNGASPTNQ